MTVCNYPDAGFFPAIRALHAASLQRSFPGNYLYKDIVRYQDESSLALLQAALALPEGDIRDAHLRSIREALNPPSIYQSIDQRLRTLEQMLLDYSLKHFPSTR